MTSQSGGALVMRMGALGDTIMTLPLITALAEATGQPCDVLGHHLWAPAMYGHLPQVRQILSLRHSKWPSWLNPSWRALRRSIKAQGDGPIFIAEHRESLHQLVRGLGRKVYALSDLEAATGPEHQSAELHRLGQFSHLIPENAESLPPALNPSPAQLDTGSHFLAKRCPGDGPLLCLQLGSNFTLRRGAPDRKSNHKWWPLDRWVAMLREVSSTFQTLRILALGAASEVEVVRSLQAAAPDLKIHDGSSSSLQEVIGILAQAQLLCSVDTGTAHIAAACDCPTVVLFGKADPRVNRPRSQKAPVNLIYAPAEPSPDDLHNDVTCKTYPTQNSWAAAHDINGIEVEQVVEAITNNWERQF